MYCPKCGKPVNENDKFCVNCAQNLNNSKNHISQADKFAIVGLILGILSMLVTLYISSIFSNEDKLSYIIDIKFNSDKIGRFIFFSFITAIISAIFLAVSEKQNGSLKILIPSAILVGISYITTLLVTMDICTLL